MRKKILSLCVAAVLAAMQIPVLVNAELNDGDVVWEEGFEEKAVGYNIIDDEHWARAEVRGTDNGLVDFSAAVAGSEGHKYLKIDANIADNSTRTGIPTAGVVTK